MIMKIKRLALFRETEGFNCGNCAEHKNTLFGQAASFLETSGL